MGKRSRLQVHPLIIQEEIKKLAQPGDKEIDASGCLIFPGFIDAHTHFDLHVAGTVTADDFATGTKAALKGGTTTIIDFGTQYPGETLAEGLKNWQMESVPAITASICLLQTGTLLFPKKSRI